MQNAKSTIYIAGSGRRRGRCWVFRINDGKFAKFTNFLLVVPVVWLSCCSARSLHIFHLRQLGLGAGKREMGDGNWLGTARIRFSLCCGFQFSHFGLKRENFPSALPNLNFNWGLFVVFLMPFTSFAVVLLGKLTIIINKYNAVHRKLGLYLN